MEQQKNMFFTWVFVAWIGIRLSIKGTHWAPCSEVHNTFTSASILHREIKHTFSNYKTVNNWTQHAINFFHTKLLYINTTVHLNFEDINLKIFLTENLCACAY